MLTWSKGAWNRANALLREALGHWSILPSHTD